ncbi:MAG: hypothetical protein ACYC3I_23470 [Gemmataceae bacterium]
MDQLVHDALARDAVRGKRFLRRANGLVKGLQVDALARQYRRQGATIRRMFSEDQIGALGITTLENSVEEVSKCLSTLFRSLTFWKEMIYVTDLTECRVSNARLFGQRANFTGGLSRSEQLNPFDIRHFGCCHLQVLLE